jgi:hypothetical protein
MEEGRLSEQKCDKLQYLNVRMSQYLVVTETGLWGTLIMGRLVG